MNPDRATLNFLNSFPEEARKRGEVLQKDGAVTQIFGNHLFIQGRVEDETGHVNMFKTGLQLEPPQGFYFEMMARSSLHKAGYMLATGTSIIDPGYRGELLVPLYKFRDGDDIELPMRAVQLVVKKAEKVLPYIVNAPLDGSSRGEGGFGSTGQRNNNSNQQQAPQGDSYYL